MRARLENGTASLPSIILPISSHKDGLSPGDRGTTGWEEKNPIAKGVDTGINGELGKKNVVITYHIDPFTKIIENILFSFNRKKL